MDTVTRWQQTVRNVWMLTNVQQIMNVIMGVPTLLVRSSVRVKMVSLWLLTEKRALKVGFLHSLKIGYIESDRIFLAWRSSTETTTLFITMTDISISRNLPKTSFGPKFLVVKIGNWMEGRNK